MSNISQDNSSVDLGSASVSTDNNSVRSGEYAAESPIPSEFSSESEAALKRELEEVRADLSKTKNDYLRALADVENVRRRAVRDREDTARYAITGFAADLLSVADNLHRALESVDPQARGSDPALDSLISGVEMTERELYTVFERYGIRGIDAIGKSFDPHMHEAMFEIENSDVPNGTVLTVLQPGYTIADRVLRPARVGVSRGGEKVKPSEVAEDGSPATQDGTQQEASSPHPSSDAYERAFDRNSPSAGTRIDESL